MKKMEECGRGRVVRDNESSPASLSQVLWSDETIDKMDQTHKQVKLRQHWVLDVTPDDLVLLSRPSDFLWCLSDFSSPNPPALAKLLRLGHWSELQPKAPRSTSTLQPDPYF
jgi:hypothetical protein